MMNSADKMLPVPVQVLSLHELPEVMPQLGWLADPQKALQPLPEDSEPVPTVDEGYQARGWSGWARGQDLGITVGA